METHAVPWADTTVRDWFESQGFPAKERHYDFDKDVFAWRHRGPSGMVTLRISDTTLRHLDSDSLLELLGSIDISKTLRHQPKANVFIKENPAASLGAEVVESDHL
jgi:hypothetical protein